MEMEASAATLSVTLCMSSPTTPLPRGETGYGSPATTRRSRASGGSLQLTRLVAKSSGDGNQSFEVPATPPGFIGLSPP